VKFIPQKSLCDTFYGKSEKKNSGQNFLEFKENLLRYYPIEFFLIFIMKEEHEYSETTSQEKNSRYFDRKSGEKFNKQYN
jgi:hypothetical protein